MNPTPIMDYEAHTVRPGSAEVLLSGPRTWTAAASLAGPPSKLLLTLAALAQLPAVHVISYRNLAGTSKVQNMETHN